MTTDGASAFDEQPRGDEASRGKAAEAGYDLGEGDLPAIEASLGVEELADENLERVAGGLGNGGNGDMGGTGGDGGTGGRAV